MNPQITNVSDTETYRFLDLSDTEPIWYQTHLILNPSDTEPTCQIPYILDTNPIRYQNISDTEYEIVPFRYQALAPPPPLQMTTNPC
jgi:hypothetical protein